MSFHSRGPRLDDRQLCCTSSTWRCHAFVGDALLTTSIHEPGFVARQTWAAL